MAINQLRRLPPSSPQYEEAQALISQWEAAVEPLDDGDGDGDAGGETVAAGDRARQAALIAEATAAIEAGENLRARSLLVEAEELAPLPSAGESLKAETEEALEPYGRYIDLLAQGEQERVLPELWQLLDEDPNDPDVRRLIADAYYNLAARALLQGDADVASEHLQEVLRMEPGNAEVERLARFADTYTQRDKDLLYRIYVKYLPPR
jgi:tetratricopeptide (TPR) repeat protein